jgi:hypothetical protein
MWFIKRLTISDLRTCFLKALFEWISAAAFLHICWDFLVYFLCIYFGTDQTHKIKFETTPCNQRHGKKNRLMLIGPNY